MRQLTWHSRRGHVVSVKKAFHHPVANLSTWREPFSTLDQMRGANCRSTRFASQTVRIRTVWWTGSFAPNEVKSYFAAPLQHVLFLYLLSNMRSECIRRPRLTTPRFRHRFLSARPVNGISGRIQIAGTRASVCVFPSHRRGWRDACRSATISGLGP